MPTYPTPEPIAVSVEVLSGTVTVVAADRTDTVVTVRPADAAKKGDIRAAQQTRVDFAAGALAVTTPKEWRTYTPFGGNPSIEVTVEVPIGSRLTGTVAVGRLLASGGLGPCELEVAAGDVLVAGPLDSVTAKVAKGDIRVEEASRGELRLETSMGELQVGISAGSGAHLEVTALHGTVRNDVGPIGGVPSSGEMLRVRARNSFGDIVIRHAATV